MTASSPQPAALQRVCDLFAAAYFAVDTTHDTSEADARHRAATRYGTPRLASELAGGQGRSLDFPIWAAHHATITTQLRPSVGEPLGPDEPTRAYRATVVTRQALGVDGWRQDLAPVAVSCTLAPTPGGWLVDRVDLSLGG
ncbi:MAG: hypothetical protein WBF75_19445 [Pseudonocardiaceae bacterium]